jgi:dTDP-4-amino-4,6-dideoxygalactose transaminase
MGCVPVAQLEQRQAIQARRKQIWEVIRRRPADWAARNGVASRHPPDRDKPTHVLSAVSRARPKAAFIARLKRAGNPVRVHNLPLHLSDMGLRYGAKPGTAGHRAVSDSSFACLPLNLTDAEQDRVIKAVISRPV